MIKKFRSMTHRQKAVLFLLALAAVAFYYSALRFAGWAADGRTSGLGDAARYGFLHGFLFGAFWLPLIRRWIDFGFNRLGGPDRPARTEAAAHSTPDPA